jgi:hypothetical protein
MPEIFGQVLSRAELRDVIAFLRALDGSSRRPAGEPEEPAFGVSNRAMQSVAKETKPGEHE